MRASRAAFGLLLAAPLAALHYDGPPAAHTGGFGEPDCSDCHFDQPVNDGAATVEIEGVPAGYRAGERYRLTVRLAREGMGRAGFQLSARFAEGDDAGLQAGTLAAVDDAVAVRDQGGVHYAGHTRAGTTLLPAGDARWTLDWTAPAADAGPVVFHLAANAAGGDLSQFEDHVYTREVVVSSGPLPDEDLSP